MEVRPSPKSQSTRLIVPSVSDATAVKFAVSPVAVDVGQDTLGEVFDAGAASPNVMAPLV